MTQQFTARLGAGGATGDATAGWAGSAGSEPAAGVPLSKVPDANARTVSVIPRIAIFGGVFLNVVMSPLSSTTFLPPYTYDA